MANPHPPQSSAKYTPPPRSAQPSAGAARANSSANLQAMRDGAALHRCNRTHRTIWALSSGEFVTFEAATDVLRDPHVIGVGDCLFGPELSQTFRWARPATGCGALTTLPAGRYAVMKR